MAAAALDLQNYCPPLLAAAADAALQQGSAAAAQEAIEQQQQQQQQDDVAEAAGSSSSSSLAPEEVVSLLLALGFFRVPAPEFVEGALEVSPGCWGMLSRRSLLLWTSSCSHYINAEWANSALTHSKGCCCTTLLPAGLC
jgi:hypothetical protein